jgi:tRNA-binding protein
MRPSPDRKPFLQVTRSRVYVATDGREEALWSKFLGSASTRLSYVLGPFSRLAISPKGASPTDLLKIDFGYSGIERSSAQIKDPDTQDCPLGKLFLGVLNFPPKQAAKFFSEVLTTGLHLLARA